MKGVVPSDKEIAYAFMALYCDKGHECDDPDCACPYVDTLRAALDARDKEIKELSDYADQVLDGILAARQEAQ